MEWTKCSSEEKWGTPFIFAIAFEPHCTEDILHFEMGATVHLVKITQKFIE